MYQQRRAEQLPGARPAHRLESGRGKRRVALPPDPQPGARLPSRGAPPIEGAIFYDAGLAWNSNSKVLWSRTAAQEAQAGLYRAPLRSWGGSIRVNALGFVVLRLDYTKPLSRSYKTPYWTLSLGPTF